MHFAKQLPLTRFLIFNFKLILILVGDPSLVAVRKSLNNIVISELYYYSL